MTWTNAKLALLVSCVVICSSTIAAELQLTLPDPAWVLAPSSPPLSPREGRLSPSEQPLSTAMMPLLTERKYTEALELFRKSFADDVASLELGQALVLDEGQSRSRISAAMYYMLGHTFLSLRQHAAAEAAFKSALVTLPDFTRVHESLGFLYLELERYDEASKHLSKAAELGVYTANLFGALGYLNQQTRNFWGAVSAYQQALMLQPDNGQWQQGLLFSLVRTSQYDSALTLIDGLLQTMPDDAGLWLLRAHAGRESGNPDIALTSLEAAIRLGDTNAGNLQVAATLHMERGSASRAVALLQAGLQQGVDFQFYDQALGWLAGNEVWDEMATLLESVANSDTAPGATQHSRLLAHQARLSQHNGDAAMASSRLQQALEMDANNSEAMMMLADLYRSANNYNQADLLYQRASADPAHRDNALISIAQLALDQDDYSRALAMLREVVTRNPSRFDLRRNIEILENLVRADGAP